MATSRLFRNRPALVASILLIVVTLSAGPLLFWLWQQNQHLESDNAELQSEVETLRTASTTGGGGVLGVSSSNPTGMQGTSAPQTRAEPSGSDSGDAAGSGLRTMLVKDFGIGFKVPTDLTDLSFAESPPASGFLLLTTVGLQKAHTCAAAGILGTLFRYPKDQNLPSTSAASKASKMALAGGYEYYYLPLGQNPCKDQAALASISHLTEELKQSLPSITQ